MVTASGLPPSRISSGSSAATVSGRVLRCSPRMRSTGVRLGTRPTSRTVIQRPPPSLLLVTPPPHPYAAVVLAGGRGARLGGRAKPQLIVGDRTILEAVLAAGADAGQPGGGRAPPTV